MPYFQYQNNILCAEEVALSAIANEFGTPCYVYSRAAIETNWHAFNDAFGKMPHRICYAVKANSNLAILNVLARLGSGFDIVSGGELERVLAAGGEASKIIFSGVGKSTPEILRALEVGIHCFDVESDVEIERLNTLAAQVGKIAQIALRVNPDIDAKTHPYISTGRKENKFGIDSARILPLCAEIKNLGFKLQTLNIGGGLGVRYHNEEPPAITDYVNALRERLKKCAYEIILEPGRAIIANAGVLLTRIEYLKHTPHKNFVIIDAAMNDLMRPALYNAWQQILPIQLAKDGKEEMYDVVGPVCESADFLGRDRLLAVKPGELLAILGAGAYGFSMSSNYNSRPRVAEVMVENDQAHLIRRRETIAELFAGEQTL
jgi:diaminopimelate decarboxylase